jgi:hypothetical protein
MSASSETKKGRITKQTVTVDWDDGDDAANLRNWATTRKIVTIVLVSALTFNM